MTNLGNNKVDDFVDNKLKFGSNYSLANDYIKYTQPLVTFDPKKRKNVCMSYASGPT